MSSNSFIRFWNEVNLVLPADPGQEIQTYTIQPADWGNGGNASFMGIRFPWLENPTETNPTVGVHPESNFLIKRYRFNFLGCQGLRPASSDSYSNGLQMQMGRQVQNQGGLLFPFVQAGDWDDVDLNWIVIPGLSQNFLSPQFLASAISIDTTNLQDIYYGRNIKLLFEIEGKATLATGI